MRVNNFAAVEPYTLTITYVAPQPLKPAQIESYTLTCERGGRVFDTQQVVVERGQVKQLDLKACAAAIQRACAANTIGLRSVKRGAQGRAACASASSASPTGRCRSTSSRSRRAAA